MRESFIFYRSFYEAIRELPRDVQGEVYSAIMDFEFNGECRTEQLKPIARSLFIAFRTQLEVNNKRYENGCKGGDYGKLGGRPKKPQKNPEETPKKPQKNPEETPKKPLKNPKKTPNVNDNDITFSNEKDNIKNSNEFLEKNISKKENFEIFKNSEKKSENSKRAVFSPPNLEDVQTYCTERNNSVDAVKWHDFYASKGWMVGKNKMQDWKACIRTWEKNTETIKTQDVNDLWKR